MSRLPFYLYSVMLIITACSKAQSFEDPKTHLLTRLPWMVQKDEVKNGNDPWTDEFPYWENCKQDNQWTFKPDFQLVFDEAANPCFGNTPNQVVDAGTWSFADQGTRINADGIIDKTDQYVIEFLDNNKLVLSYTQTAGGNTFNEKLTFVH